MGLQYCEDGRNTVVSSFWDEPIVIYDEPHGSSVIVIDRRPGRSRSEYALDFRTREADPRLADEPELVEHLRLHAWFDSGPGREIALKYGWVTPEQPGFESSVVAFHNDIVMRLRAEVRLNDRAIELLAPDEFEVLVAELLRDMGCDVQLTPRSRDGGRDIFAFAALPPGLKCVTLVECKRLRRDRKVGVDVVKQLLFTVREQDRATRGMVVTTSSFSAVARRLESAYENILSLHDHTALTEWLQRYGTWTTSDRDGLWLPTAKVAK